jgi:pimeloyl-ACP methyl ester carboxylesterase
MIVDLVRTTAADGLRLDGALHVPHDGAAQVAVDAAIFLHGVGSNFYNSTLNERLSPALLELGVAALWANTRGHDGLYTASTTGARRRQGAAYEIVDECRLDIAAWMDFLVQRGFRRVAQLGHSLGAIKALYATAHEPHEATSCVLAVSPARLCHSLFTQGPDGESFLEALAAAEKHIRENRPDALIETRVPFPLAISAGAFVDKYGPQDRYDILKFAAKVSCPTLFTFGSRELQHGGVAFAGLPEALSSLPDEGQQFDIATIVGADHLYTGVHESLAEEIVRWLRAKFPVK